MGVALEVIEQARKGIHSRNERKGVGIWPEHWHAWTAFTSMATQWHWAGGMAPRPCGLRYEALPVVLAGVRQRVPQAQRQPLHVVFEQLEQLEEAALLAMRNA